MKTVNHLYRLLTKGAPAAISILAAVTVFMGGQAQANVKYPANCSPEANIIFLVNASNGMGNDRLSQAKSAIKQFIAQHQAPNYGLVFFACSGRMGVPLGENTQSQIESTLNRQGAGGMAALDSALSITANDFKSKLGRHPFNNARSAIVLITNSKGNKNSCDQRLDCITGKFRDLHDPGITVDGHIHSIPTHVIGVGSGMNQPDLTAIAQAGGTGNYIPTNNVSELTNALETIIASLPSEEVCDGLDNDCNGLIDDGLNPPDPSNPGPEFLCDTGMPGQCALGYNWCENGQWSCIPINQPQTEVCNGMDNDCDGFIDATDSSGTGNLQPGDSLRNLCGTCGPAPVEICNGIDDDCDGIIDNGAVCPQAGEECINGACVRPCDGENCPQGLVCSDGFCQAPCAVTKCDDGWLCDPPSGACYNPCDGVTCPDPNTTCINGTCGTCWDLGCPDGKICVQPGICKDDPCAEEYVQCGPMEACRVVNDRAVCVSSCAQIACNGLETCEDGQCVQDLCANISCPAWEVCMGGDCHTNPCLQTTCPEGQICAGVLRNDSTIETYCLDNPCSTMSCYMGQECEVICIGGNCTGRCVFQNQDGTPDPVTPTDGNDYGDRSWYENGGTDHNQDQKLHPDLGDNLGCSCAMGALGESSTGEGGNNSRSLAGGWFLVLLAGLAFLRRREGAGPG